MALNPGSSFRGLHDSLVKYGGDDIEIDPEKAEDPNPNPNQEATDEAKDAPKFDVKEWPNGSITVDFGADFWRPITAIRAGIAGG